MVGGPHVGSTWLLDSGPARRPAAAIRPRPSDQAVQPAQSDSERFDEHLRPAWHVVVATLLVLGAAVLTSWLGH